MANNLSAPQAVPSQSAPITPPVPAAYAAVPTPSVTAPVTAPVPSFSWTKFFIKLDRLAAWVLMIVIIMYAITGYGMTRGLINGAIARSLHLSWLGGVGIVAFIIHTSWAIHMACRRRQIWNMYTRFLLIAFYILLAGFFLYIHFFYVSAPAAIPLAATNYGSLPISGERENEQESEGDDNAVSVTPIATGAAVIPLDQTASSTSVPVTTPTPVLTPTPVTTPVPTPAKTVVFTAATLAAYNGRNGQPAYVAVDGAVYDLSSVFINGQHQGHLAGQDLTDFFYSQHYTSILSRYPIVGAYQK